MSLYSDWKARAENLQSDAAYQQYWSTYFEQETEVYTMVSKSVRRRIKMIRSTSEMLMIASAKMIRGI